MFYTQKQRFGPDPILDKFDFISKRCNIQTIFSSFNLKMSETSTPRPYTKYHSECMDLVKKSLACQEQQSIGNFDEDCKPIIDEYKACKKAEREKIIAKRRKETAMW